MAKKKAFDVEEGLKYLESYAKQRRTVVLEPGVIDSLRKAGLKVRVNDVWAERWGPEPVGFIARIEPGMIVERNKRAGQPKPSTQSPDGQGEQ